MIEEKKIKCIAISDTHGSLPQLPECDVVCCAGDISPLDYQGDQTQMVSWFCLEFLPWVEKLPCKKFILVGGNHDFFLQNIHWFVLWQPCQSRSCIQSRMRYTGHYV